MITSSFPLDDDSLGVLLLKFAWYLLFTRLHWTLVFGGMSYNYEL
jgi:hypothetical protein